MASFWDSYNEQQQQQQAGQQGNSPGPSMPGHEQGISAPIPSTSSTRHNSVLDSVHSASFLYQSPSDDLQQFQANLNASRSLPQPTHFGHFDPRHTGYDSYLSVSPKTVDSPGLLPPLPMSFPPFNTSMNKPSSGRPVVYEPYPHNFGASFSTGSTINPAASSNPYASQGYQSNMAKLEGTSANAQQQASQTPSSTIGELLNSIPRGEQHLSNALPSIPRPGGSALLTIKPFTRKLFDMLIDPELQDLLYWDEPGRAIVICSGHPKFKGQVLHPAFGHSSVQSFHRQLNVYRFKRVDIHSLLIRTLPRCECSAWAHPDFARDGERFLYKLQPRPSKARRLKKEQQEADRRRKSFEETGRSVTSPSARRRRSSYDDSLSPEDLTLLHQMASPTYSNGSASAEDDAHTMSLVAAGLVAPAQMSARPLA